MKKCTLVFVLSILISTLSYSQNDLIVFSRGDVIDSVKCRIVTNSVDTINYLSGDQQYKLACDYPPFTAIIKPDKHIEYGIKLKLVRFFQNPISKNSINDLFSVNSHAKDALPVRLYWFGLDFSKVNITLGNAPRSQYSNLFFLDCNDYIISDKGFQKFIRNFNLLSDTGAVTQRNSRVDPYMIFNRNQKSFTIDSIRETLKQFGSKYNGIGVVVFITNINKVTESETFHVVFFDIRTRSLILCLNEQTSVRGVGMANHWTNFIRDYLDLFSTKRVWMKRYSG